MFSMSGLSKERERQLQLEYTLDKKLVKCHCRDKVLNYLFNIRELNRKLTLNQLQSNFYKVPELYKEQLNLTDRLQEIIHNQTEYELCEYGLDSSISLMKETMTNRFPNSMGR